MIEFTHEQRLAIDYPSSMVLTACPGSGKTAVIVEKIVLDLASCKEFQGVIAISYTNKASDELKRRCLKALPDSKSSFFGTIDKFYLTEIIYQFLNHLWGGVNNLQVVRFNDLDSVVKDSLSVFFNAEYVCENIDVFDFKEIKNLYAKGFLVLEFIPLLAYFILCKSLACRRYISKKYNSMYIDEYQDAGFIQHLIFLKLFGFGVKTVAVGDIDQSIFLYAGKSSKYLMSLLDDDSGFKPFEITINHRSHSSIVNYASRMLSENCELLVTDDTQVYRTTINGSQQEVAKWIDDNINNVKQTFGISKEREIAILAATNSSVLLMSGLVRTKLRAYIDDDLSKLGGDVSLLIKELLSYRFNVLVTAQEIIDGLSIKVVERNALREMRNVIKYVRKADDSNFIPALRQAVNLLINKDFSAQHIDAVNAVLQNKMMLNNYLPVGDDELQLMTLHKSKGLEFDFVFHLDLYDWILPRREFIEGSFDLVFSNYEQCLNLHYVGVTRAKKAVALINSTERLNYQHELKRAKPSQFLSLRGVEGLYRNI
ncbi:ATP-dependent DNA helicase [Buttiauxella brennerae ATCC 51605]|uniref:DNA 3'-5' helicase n=1 Tax=Buttiauxella brennerae ATCC 51605 TaxID=1354251 RepID=A0A1B7ISJ5_9ENTR|nr:ATP-dependent helicase [Buttiauxella brennerae]OAT32766.1 ATP-dependent DNA helicase [Buttiauxella brennerae ATCC 51605]